ncbi:hypothetical protein [Planomonospora venezuelensis]|uniref:Adhesin domain-containing protein n=1 Tax=Planomonospora venezuelensis TaxID=1999 RepID=A0A841CX16_PLAVE|nr:hypothetical protein [Planomonospora venezuelensis]MBB5962461.1 hypothetical protein [Planomonospora venezuelensis]GIN00844.1 hypothetical protein Pve01_25020 [Planomonospora venezuelensis]
MWTIDSPGSPGAAKAGGLLPWIAAGAPLVIAGVVVAAVSVQGAAGAPEPARFAGIDSLDVTTDHGDVEIVPSGTGEVLVTRRPHGRAPRSESWGGGSLTVGQVCDEGLVCTSLRDTSEDHVDYTFAVPRGVDVTVRSRNGDIILRGPVGRVDARTDGGTVRTVPAP